MTPPKSGISRSGIRKPRGSSSRRGSSSTSDADELRRQQVADANAAMNSVSHLGSRQQAVRREHQMQAAQGISGLAQMQSQHFLQSSAAEIAPRFEKSHQPQNAQNQIRREQYHRLAIQEASNHSQSDLHRQLNSNERRTQDRYREENTEAGFLSQISRRVQQESIGLRRPPVAQDQQAVGFLGALMHPQGSVQHQVEAARFLVAQSEQRAATQGGAMHSDSSLRNMRDGSVHFRGAIARHELPRSLPMDTVQSQSDVHGQQHAHSSPLQTLRPFLPPVSSASSHGAERNRLPFSQEVALQHRVVNSSFLTSSRGVPIATSTQFADSQPSNSGQTVVAHLRGTEHGRAMGREQNERRQAPAAVTRTPPTNRISQGEHATTARGRANRGRRERPPVPRQGQTNEAGAVRALQKLEESMSGKFSELFGRIQSLENATMAMGGNICGALDGFRQDCDAQNKASMECYREVGDKICQSIDRSTAHGVSGNRVHDDEEDLSKELANAQEYVKYMTCAEFLGLDKGDSFYCRFISQSKAHESPLVQLAAKFVLGESTNFMEFLRKKTSTKRNGRMVLVDNATLIGRGQGNAQEAIRKALVAAFASACPRSSALHTSTTLSPDQVAAELKRMYDNAEHKYDTSLASAWRAAQCTARTGAYRTAKGAHTILAMQHPGRELAPLPAKPSNADALDPSLHKIGFVSFKISKHVEFLAIGRKGVRFSHGPDWAREVLFCHDKLNQALPAEGTSTNRTPVFLSSAVHIPLEESEVERLRLLAN